jgi:hypothetical protein
MSRKLLTTAVVTVVAGAILWGLAADGGAGLAGERRITPLAPAAAFPADATWVLRSDRKLDGRVDESRQEDRITLRAKGDVVAGEYVGQKAQGKENGSRFGGEVTHAPAGTPLLTLRQTDKWYAATYAGRLVGEGRVVGCWFDSDGRAGDFELVVERK